ncbi:ribonuclease P protein component [Salinisphaera dokdonensis]|uniref:ribonuclease P protein component n=1 Tax=Salinisphaera dokdonensis TaxID=454598 RepID=UPI0033409E2B
MAQAGFPATARLRQASEFRAVFAQGRKFVSRGFVIIAAPGGADQPRLGLALAKRRIARAVDRNRVKRVLRESFRLNRHRLGPIDVVVLARSRTAAIDNAALFAQLAEIWPQLVRLDNRPPHDHGSRKTR